MDTTPNSCNRNDRDGTKCKRRTRHPDRWCRTCDGFIQPTQRRNDGGVDVRELHLPRNPDPCPFTVEDAHDAFIHPTVTERWRAIHGGSETAADRAIRIMAEDLVVDGRWSAHSTGLTLAAHGFRAFISRDLTHIIRYGAAQSDLTWPQYAAGVEPRMTRAQTLEHRRAHRVRMAARAGWVVEDREGRTRMRHAADGRTLDLPADLALLSRGKWRNALIDIGFLDREGA